MKDKSRHRQDRGNDVNMSVKDRLVEGSGRAWALNLKDGVSKGIFTCGFGVKSVPMKAHQIWCQSTEQTLHDTLCPFAKIMSYSHQIENVSKCTRWGGMVSTFQTRLFGCILFGLSYGQSPLRLKGKHFTVNPETLLVLWVQNETYANEHR